MVSEPPSSDLITGALAAAACVTQPSSKAALAGKRCDEDAKKRLGPAGKAGNLAAASGAWVGRTVSQLGPSKKSLQGPRVTHSRTIH